MNTFVIDLKKGVSYSNPYINKFSHEFDSVEFVIDGDDMLNDCAFAVVYFIEGNTGMTMENGGSLTKEYNNDGKISLIWTLDRSVSCDDGVVLYQVVAYKQQDGNITAVWYSPQGRIVVGDSIDTTEYETLQIGSEPSLVSQFLVMANSNKTDIDILKESINTLEQTANQLDEKTHQNAQSIMLNSENISSLNNKTDAMDSELSKVGDIANSNTQSIIANREDISNLNVKVKSIDSELSNVKQTAYSNNDEILIHQSRLDEADNSINNINSNISDIISRVESNKTNINQNLDKINDTRSIAADNQKNINANSKSIADVSILVDGVVSDLNGKVDKIEGMGLSQNSFTDGDKQLLESVNKKPGIITDNGGEVFNDYTSNVAGGRYTTAKGKGTVAASDVVYEVKNIAFNGYDANVIIVNDKESLSNIKIGDVISGEFEYDIDIGGFVEPGGTKQFTAKVVSIDYEEVKLDKAVASSNLNPWIVKSSSVTGTRYNIQNVDGMYNIEDDDGRYLHITGNGESDANRSNAYTLDKNGVAWFKGGIKTGGNSETEGVNVCSDKRFTYAPQLEITVEEAVNTITINEINGISLADYNYTAIKCVVENAVLETAGPNAQVTVYVNSKAYDTYQTPMGSPTTFINANTKRYWSCYTDIKSGLLLSAANSTTNETWTSPYNMPINSQNLHLKDKIEYLNISILMGETFPIGTKFRLWFK